MGTVIGIVNQKGGVGKTTSTIEIATNLHIFFKKNVLVIDFDQQGDTTRSVGADPEYNNIFQVINADLDISECIQNLEYFDLICSSKQLSTVNKTFTDRDDIYLLDEVLKQVKADYDYIIIDNNPDLGLLFSMSVVAADYIIIPVECDNNSINGLLETESIIEKFKNSRNKESHAEILGYIMTKKEETNMHTLAMETVADIASQKEQRPFIATVSKGVRISESKTLQIPVSFEQRSSRQAREYNYIAQLIVERTGGAA